MAISRTIDEFGRPGSTAGIRPGELADAISRARSQMEATDIAERYERELFSLMSYNLPRYFDSPMVTAPQLKYTLATIPSCDRLFDKKLLLTR